MIEFDSRRFWFDGSGRLLSYKLPGKEKNGFILVTKTEDNVYIARWKQDNRETWKKLWFSDPIDGKLQFMQDSSEEEIKIMKRMYNEILAKEVMEK